MRQTSRMNDPLLVVADHDRLARNEDENGALAEEMGGQDGFARVNGANAVTDRGALRLRGHGLLLAEGRAEGEGDNGG